MSNVTPRCPSSQIQYSLIQGFSEADKIWRVLEFRFYAEVNTRQLWLHVRSRSASQLRPTKSSCAPAVSDLSPVIGWPFDLRQIDFDARIRIQIHRTEITLTCHLKWLHFTSLHILVCFRYSHAYLGCRRLY